MFFARDISVCYFLHSNYYHRQGLGTFFSASAASAFRELYSDLGPANANQHVHIFSSVFFFPQRYANPESHLRAWCQCVPSLHIWGIVLPSPSLIKVPASKQPVSHNGPIRLQRVKYSISFSVHESLSAGYDQLGSVVMNGGRRKWKLQELPGVTGGWNIRKAKWTIAY